MIRSRATKYRHLAYKYGAEWLEKYYKEYISSCQKKSITPDEQLVKDYVDAITEVRNSQ